MISYDKAAEVATRIATRESQGADRYTAIMQVAHEYGLKPETVMRYQRMEAQVATPVIVTPHYTLTKPEPIQKKPLRVCAIGDAHDDPRLPKDRFKWLGRHIAKTRPKRVVQIGDFLTLDSLCSYIKNDTFEARSKPTFLQDIGSFDESLEIMAKHGGDAFAAAKPHITFGNHEDRIESFSDRTPEVYGMMASMIYSILERRGWTYSPYGLIHFIAGVGFVHVPMNEMGKPYGGKTAETRIANDTTTDLVIGHSHKSRVHTAPKIGANNYVRVINLGCALPEGHVEKYAKHNTTGWTYGVYDLVLSGGHITDWKFISMRELEKVYG